jgi:hypothetical protein
MHMKVERIPAFDVTVKRLRVPDAWVRYVGVTKGLKSVGYQPRCRGGSSPRSASGPLLYDRQLGQGDPLGRASIHEPAGCGPFPDHPGDTTLGNDASTRRCLDALIECGPYATTWTGWSPGGRLWLWQEYNYAARGVRQCTGETEKPSADRQ